MSSSVYSHLIDQLFCFYFQTLGPWPAALRAFICCAYRFSLGTCQYPHFQSCLQWWQRSFCKCCGTNVFLLLFLVLYSLKGSTRYLNQYYLYTQLYLTDLSTRESILLCTKEHPILQLSLHDDSIWAATTDSSVHRWPAEVHNPQKAFQRGGSFLAGNLSFSRARASLEGSTPVSHT